MSCFAPACRRQLLLLKNSPVFLQLGAFDRPFQDPGWSSCDRNAMFAGHSVRNHMGHAHHHHHGPGAVRGQAGEHIARIGLFADAALAAVKASAGYLSGSTAIIADAAHSVSDIVLSGVALWSLKAGGVPRDKEHPYGHGKFETVGALGISGMLLLTAGGIAWHAVEVLQAVLPTVSLLDVSTWSQLSQEPLQGHGHGLGAHDHHNDEHQHGLFGHHHGLDNENMSLALSAAVTSIGVKEGLYWATKKVGEVQGSQLLKANAWHHRSDAISSIVALIGVGGAMVGVPWLDPLAGIAVSGMIAKAGLETGYQSVQELVDKGVPESVLSPIRNTVLKVEGVEDCHDLRGRRAGSCLYIDAHIEVDPWLSVSAAHNIGEAVRHQIHEKHPEVAETFVHIDPARNWNAEDSNKENVAASETDKTNDPNLSEENNANLRLQPAVEKDIREVLASKYSQDVSVRQVTCHFLQGKVVAEVEISLSPNLLIRDALERAKDMERDIESNVPDVSSVKMQLRLKDP